MESPPTPESFFVPILPKVKGISDVKQAKKLLQDYTTSSSISLNDKQSIIYNLENVKTRGKLDIYLYNSLLYYEGHSITKVPKKKKKRERKNYFTYETENAILLYNKLEPSDERSRLYDSKIHYPIFKLTQNIIHTFKFYHTEVENLEHLQHEIEVFLLGKLPLYHHSKSIDDRLYKIIVRKYSHGNYSEYLKDYELNPPEYEDDDEEVPPPITEEGFRLLLEKNASFAEKYGLYQKGTFLKFTKNSDKISQETINSFIKRFDGILKEECFDKLKLLTPPKAYSYFGTITKRWLINYTDKIYNKKLHISPIQDLNPDDSPLCEPHPNPVIKDQLSAFMDDYIEYVTENIYTLFPKEKDARLADIVLDLFRQREHIEIFNKKALYFEIRDKGDFKTPKITKISEKLYKLFKVHYVYYLEHGYYNFGGS